MKLILFENKSAERVYNNYLQRCKKSIKILSVKDQEECLLEINSHIYEYLSAKNIGDEMQQLLDILDRLGEPEETFKEIVASKKLVQASNTFNPKYVFQALFLNMGNGLLYAILSIFFLFLSSFPILIILKIIYPNMVGMSTENGISFGYINNNQGILKNDVLGNWFIPISIVLTIIFYFIVILTLKGVRAIKTYNIELKSRKDAYQVSL